MRIMLVNCLSATALLVATPALSETTEPKQPSELEQAKTKLQEGKPEAAIALVEPIIAKAEADEAKDPDAACPASAAGFLIALMARQNMNISVTVENDWCEAMLVQGYALVELKRFDQAAARLGRLVRHDKGNANYLAEYGFALRSNGQIDQALDAYKRAKSAASRYTDKAVKRHWRAVALRGIGYIAFERAQWDDAERAYRDSLKDEPDNPIALSELELIRQKRGK